MLARMVECVWVYVILYGYGDNLYYLSLNMM